MRSTTTEPLWWRLSAGPRFAQGFADLRFEKKTRFLLVSGARFRAPHGDSSAGQGQPNECVYRATIIARTAVRRCCLEGWPRRTSGTRSQTPLSTTLNRATGKLSTCQPRGPRAAPHVQLITAPSAVIWPFLGGALGRYSLRRAVPRTDGFVDPRQQLLVNMGGRSWIDLAHRR
jgi:hypothetical protein